MDQPCVRAESRTVLDTTVAPAYPLIVNRVHLWSADQYGVSAQSAGIQSWAVRWQPIHVSRELT